MIGSIIVDSQWSTIANIIDRKWLHCQPVIVAIADHSKPVRAGLGSWAGLLNWASLAFLPFTKKELGAIHFIIF